MSAGMASDELIGTHESVQQRSGQDPNAEQTAEEQSVTDTEMEE